MVSALLGSYLAVLSLVFVLVFSYLFQRDKDKRKLMFLLIFVYSFFLRIPEILPGFENTPIMSKIIEWGPLPITSAILIAVISNLLKQEDFSKPFRLFLVILLTSTVMMFLPFPVNPYPEFLYVVISMVTIAISVYLVAKRRNIPDFMFLFTVACFSLAEVGRSAMGSGTEFIVFSYTCAHISLALAFLTARESGGNGIASFFALEREYEKAQHELELSRDQLVKAERLAAIGQAATMVGHDLRNPLQAIENGLYYINTELSTLPVSQKTMETLQAIHNSVVYADKIVKDLQSFASTRDPLFREMNINTLVKETFSHVKTPENVETIIELGEIPKMEIDKDMMKRVFVNLTVNGIQAMEEKQGMLKVSTKKTKDFIEVKFQDTGIGIKKENIPKIFTPFFTTKAQGMGMGLSVCKRFVEIHDGCILVESEEGEGSVFTVKLPIQRNGGANLD